nr:MAG TPA: hypothetical protein [Caudoviricetes sp.]
MYLVTISFSNIKLVEASDYYKKKIKGSRFLHSLL